MSQNTFTMSRRSFIAGALATGAALAMAKPSIDASVAFANDAAVDGGTLNYYLTDPVSIDPYNVQENQGMQVCNALFDALTTYDGQQGKLIGKAASSWEANEDATEFTFHLREGATFHNGEPVTAQSFVYAWNRLCSPLTDPENPSVVSYHLSMVEGYDDVVAGVKGATLNMEAKDDYTLVVHLSFSYADFPYVVSHLATAPVPESAASDMATYQWAPVGNGAFKMDGKWESGQYIKIVRNDAYWGDKAHIDGVDFKILLDIDTAYLEFEAGNLDNTQIPNGRISAVAAQYGVAPDGYTANPGEETLLGPEDSIYYLTCNNQDKIFSNAHMRKAVSYAIDRQAICDTIFEGTRVPADNFITPGIAGYEAGAWEAAKYDVAAAKEEIELAKKDLGVDSFSIILNCNSGSGHEDIMQLIMANLKEIGVEAKMEAVEWASYLQKLQDGDYQIGRLGWIADYPIMDNYLYPMFYTGNGDNRSQYSNPAVDEALSAARAIVDDAERIAALQKVNRMIAEDFPVIPLMLYRHTIVCSNRVNNLYVGSLQMIDFTKCWLSA